MAAATRTTYNAGYECGRKHPSEPCPGTGCWAGTGSGGATGAAARQHRRRAARPPRGEFVFKQGPLFAQIILADEINRATPRTQSALLEAMSDRQVSLDGLSRPLASPFMVLATQNPYEFEGTFPLPESQMDRFLMRLRIGYPDRQTEKEVLKCHRDGEPIDGSRPVLS